MITKEQVIEIQNNWEAEVVKIDWLKEKRLEYKKYAN